MVLLMYLEMLGQVGDPVTQQCDLHFRRTGIGIVRFKFFDDFVFLFSLLCHNYPPIICFIKCWLCQVSSSQVKIKVANLKDYPASLVILINYFLRCGQVIPLLYRP